MRKLQIHYNTLPLQQSFTIAHNQNSTSANDSIEVITVSLTDSHGNIGRGECRPYVRYTNTTQVLQEIESVKADIEQGMDRYALLESHVSGAARNALDCALWDLEAQQLGRSVWDLTKPFINPSQKNLMAVPTVQTISLDHPEEMARYALTHREHNILKIKLGGQDDIDLGRLHAIHAARPDAQLVVDANEGWNIEQLTHFISQAKNLGVVMIEQPLPAKEDAALIRFDSQGIVLCGDESIHTAQDIVDKSDRYHMVNIKLDKSGGLTHALEMIETLRRVNEGRDPPILLMVGCMVCTSLAIQPALILAQKSDLNDLDGPWWLKNDHENGARFKNGTVVPGTLWGIPRNKTPAPHPLPQ